MTETGEAGALMAAESAEAASVFARTVETAMADGRDDCVRNWMQDPPRAIYTIARGSSDAAANILSYEFMRVLGRPMTSLPPSVFSLGRGVDLSGTLCLVVSQSGASDDLVRSATGARQAGAKVIGLVNAKGSPVEAAADLVLPIGAGPERAVPATKSVVGAIAAGLSLLRLMAPDYGPGLADAAKAVAALEGRSLPRAKSLVAAILRSRHVYVIGRDTGFGAAQELALKLKECCALHAEAYSSSEVLHGPLQLATNPLLVLILDTEQPGVQTSLDQAETRLRAAGATVERLRPSDAGANGLTPAAAAAALLILAYPLVLQTALALGHDPDRPATLSKVTQTT
jgi:glutamine---fructose-6-phosphate transaminase (isomerizing)